jgi:hypothetical protein
LLLLLLLLSSIVDSRNSGIGTGNFNSCFF